MRKIEVVRLAEELHRRRDVFEIQLVHRLIEAMLEDVKDDFIRVPVVDLPKCQATAATLAQLLKMLTHPRPGAAQTEKPNG